MHTGPEVMKEGSGEERGKSGKEWGGEEWERLRKGRKEWETVGKSEEGGGRVEKERRSG